MCVCVVCRSRYANIHMSTSVLLPFDQALSGLHSGVRYVYVLESTNKLRKYVGVIDVLVSMVTAR